MRAVAKPPRARQARPPRSSTARASRARKRGACIDPTGYDAGKKIKGKKRHILVDTQGLLMHAIVHSADIQDRDGGALLMASLFGAFPFLIKLYADGGYQGPEFQSGDETDSGARHRRDRQAVGSSHRLRRAAQALDRERLYNVASSSFQWSSLIERGGRRRRPELIARTEIEASQFVASESEASRALMGHRRPVPGPIAVGGADGPAHGSPSAGAGFVRCDEAEPSAPDRGVRPPRAVRSTHEFADEPRRCPRVQSEDGEHGNGR